MAHYQLYLSDSLPHKHNLEFFFFISWFHSSFIFLLRLKRAKFITTSILIIFFLHPHLNQTFLYIKNIVEQQPSRSSYHLEARCAMTDETRLQRLWSSLGHGWNWKNSEVSFSNLFFIWSCFLFCKFHFSPLCFNFL